MKNILSFSLLVLSIALPVSQASQTLQDFPDRELNGQWYELVNSQGRCADIPTKNSEISSPKVIAWQCANKDWQKWIKLNENAYRNAFHYECILDNVGLTCGTGDSGVDQFPVSVKVNNGYRLQNSEGKCADIPTNNGRVSAEKVIAWDCQNKDWQKWVKLSDGTYRNFFHPECILEGGLLNCGAINYGVYQFPVLVKVNDGYLLKTPQGKCADIPTNNGVISSEKVVAWECGDKGWQVWNKLDRGLYRNAFHKNCFLGKTGLSCNIAGSVTNNDYVESVNGHFELNRLKALRIGGKPNKK